MRAFSRSGDVLVAVMEPDEVVVLGELAGEVATLLRSHGSRRDDPALIRLLPDAYRDDEESAADFRRFTADGLVERKIENAMTVLQTLKDGSSTRRRTRIELDERSAGAWMRAITDIRLSLAARLGITDEDSAPEGADEHTLDVFNWLAFVQDSLVRALDARR